MKTRPTSRAFAQRSQIGDAILARLATLDVPDTVRPFAQAFRKAHALAVEATAFVDATTHALDDARAVVRRAREEAEAAVDAVVLAIVAAAPERRRSPFAGYVDASPTECVRTNLAALPKALRELADAVDAARPHRPVAEANARVRRAAVRLERALADLPQPDAARASALETRKALFTRWDASLTRLRRACALAFGADSASYRALFASSAANAAPHRAPQAPTEAKPSPAAA